MGNNEPGVEKTRWLTRILLRRRFPGLLWPSNPMLILNPCHNFSTAPPGKIFYSSLLKMSRFQMKQNNSLLSFKIRGWGHHYQGIPDFLSPQPFVNLLYEWLDRPPQARNNFRIQTGRPIWNMQIKKSEARFIFKEFWGSGYEHAESILWFSLLLLCSWLFSTFFIDISFNSTY